MIEDNIVIKLKEIQSKNFESIVEAYPETLSSVEGFAYSVDYLLERGSQYLSELSEEKSLELLKILNDLNSEIILIQETLDRNADVYTKKKRADYLNSFFDNSAQKLRKDIVEYNKKTSLKGRMKLREFRQEAEKNSNEVRKILQDAQVASGKIVASQFVKIFENEAKENQYAVRGWLFSITILLTLFSFWFFKIATELLVQVSKVEAGNLFLQVVLSKLLILSFFSYIGFQLFKSLNANQHLYTLNKHRANILRVYQSLIDAANNESTKDTILLQTINAIYEAGDSGFITSKDNTKNLDVNSILEFVKKRF